MDRNVLEDYKDQINEADKEILILIKRRYQLAKKLAEYKHKQNLPIFDENREDEIIRQVVKLAEEMNISQGAVRKMYHELLLESKVQMEAYIRKKFKIENEEELEN